MVIRVLQGQGQNVTWETFHNQKEPKLFGDILICISTGSVEVRNIAAQEIQHYGEKYVHHYVGRSWYAPGRAEMDKNNTESVERRVQDRDRQK